MRYFLGKTGVHELSGIYMAEVLCRGRDGTLYHVFSMPYGLIRRGAVTGDELFFRSVVTRRQAEKEKREYRRYIKV